MLSMLLSNKSPCLSQLPHLNTKHDVTWYQISHLIGWFGTINPIPAKPRTAVKHWHRVPREVVDAPSLDTFKARLDGALSNLIWLKMSLLTAGGLD